MEKKLHIMTFWAVNGELEEEKLKEQLKEMKEYGFDGTIFHPRFYPGKPPYMGKKYLEILSETILYAKSLGMEFWIYDENGWPSGSAGGRVKKRFPDRKCEWAILKDGCVRIKSRQNFNTLDREEMQYFIETIYDGYRLGLKPEAFAWVTGFFSDEVGFMDGHGASFDQGGIPWCEEAVKRMEALLGTGAVKPELLFTEGEGYRQLRYHYWQILADILSESFYGAVNSWCEKYGKRYTAHLKGEENIFFQIPYSGSCYTNLKKINTPAVDALERYPGNHYYPRIASSLAAQFGDGECLAEALGGSGWGLRPEDVEKYVGWLAESGINRFAFHLWQYDRNSASVRDWPPNIPWGMTWKEAMPSLIQRLRVRWDSSFERQNSRCLLVAPVRGCMAEYRPEEACLINEHNGSGTPGTKSGRISREFSDFAEQMYEAGMDYDVTEERILEENGVLGDGNIRIGKVVYTSVYAGTGCLWERKKLICDMKKTGLLHEAEEFTWKYKRIAEEGNQIPLEWRNGEARVRWKGNHAQALSACRVRILDPVESLTLHVVSVDGKSEGESSQSEISVVYRPKEGGEPFPFAFLEGDFLVKNELPYRDKDKRQLLSAGEFYLEPLQEEEEIDCRDLVTAGFPFCRAGIYVRAKRYIGRDGMLRLGRPEADCAFVKIGGQEAGYVWGPDWKLRTSLPEGIYEVELKLLPSTFNTYGPHHHRDGDRHLISPDQYMGKKNFAEEEDAPEYTWISEWHIVKFGIR